MTVSHQDSSQYSGRSQQCCSLESLHSSSYFQVIQSHNQCFGGCTERSIDNWYHRHFIIIIIIISDLTFLDFDVEIFTVTYFIFF